MLDPSSGEVTGPCYPLKAMSLQGPWSLGKVPPLSELISGFQAQLCVPQMSQQTAEVRRSLWPVGPHPVSVKSALLCSFEHIGFLSNILLGQEFYD